MGFLESRENLAANTDRGFLGRNLLHRKTPCGIKLSELVAQPVTTLREHSHPPPLLVADLEDTPHELMRWQIAVTVDGSTVLVFDLSVAGLKLPNDL